MDKAIYRDGARLPCDDVESACKSVQQAGSGFVWIGVHNPDASEFTRIAQQMHLHPLAVEDALKGNQRAKIDFYEHSVFVVLKTLRYLDATSDVETGELMIFVGHDFVMTVRRGDMQPLHGVRARLEGAPEILGIGPMAVLHHVIDEVVDVYRRIDDELAIDLDAIEEGVLGGIGHVEAADIYRLKREVLEFKRGAVPLLIPMRRITHGDEQHLVPKRLRPFYGDVLDHLLAVVEHAESYDRLLTDILSAHLAQVGIQQNEDMRRISAWAAIAVVPTAIAGIYGMNFEYMPELAIKYAYFVVLALMATLCTSLYVAFRRSGWL